MILSFSWWSLAGDRSADLLGYEHLTTSPTNDDRHAMNTNTDRSPIWGLTGQQFTTLDRRHREHKITQRADSQAWLAVAVEAATRCAALLAANDVRGALYEAEIWQGANVSAQAAADLERHTAIRNANADARLERTTKAG